MNTITGYQIRVEGHLDDHWSHRLPDISLTRHPDGTTTLTGTIDQPMLHGILTLVRDIGAVLLAVHVTPDVAVVPPSDHALARPLRTDRLLLRNATPDDVDATWTYRCDPAVNEWLTGAEADIDAYGSLFTEPTRLATAVVVELHDGTVIGDLMLRREDAWTQQDAPQQTRRVHAEVGWVLDPAHHRRGYGTEAVRELLRHCFEDLHLRRVTANCFLGNEASWRLMERLGMRRELHAVRESAHRNGHWLDVVGYALLADDWASSTPSSDPTHTPTPESGTPR